MLDHVNSYFEAMDETLDKYYESKDAREIELQALLNSNDWYAVKNWHKREKEEHPFPFGEGCMVAHSAWYDSIEHKSNFFEVGCIPNVEDTHCFVKCLREAQVDEFAITNYSTGLMEFLHDIVNREGCKLVGLCTVLRYNNWLKITEPCNGILISI